jgi:excisionase family DNA binding protein
MSLEARNQMTDRLLTRREVSETLRVTERQVDRLTRAGKLKSLKLGGTAVRFWHSAVMALLV